MATGRGPLNAALGSDPGLLRQDQVVIDLHAEVAHRALRFGVTERQVTGSDDAGSLGRAGSRDGEASKIPRRTNCYGSPGRLRRQSVAHKMPERPIWPLDPSEMRDAVPEHESPDIFSATRIVGASLIDSGRTLAIRLKKANGCETLILLAPKDAEELQLRISEALNDPNPP